MGVSIRKSTCRQSDRRSPTFKSSALSVLFGEMTVSPPFRCRTPVSGTTILPPRKQTGPPCSPQPSFAPSGERIRPLCSPQPPSAPFGEHTASPLTIFAAGGSYCSALTGDRDKYWLLRVFFSLSPLVFHLKPAFPAEIGKRTAFCAVFFPYLFDLNKRMTGDGREMEFAHERKIGRGSDLEPVSALPLPDSRIWHHNFATP